MSEPSLARSSHCAGHHRSNRPRRESRNIGDRLPGPRKRHGIGYGNIAKCCTKVCPENITITGNGIIPLKERVVDRFFDPLGKLFRTFGWK